MKVVVIMLAACLGVALGNELSEKQIKEMEEGLRRWKEIAANPEVIPEEQRIEKLALGVFKTSRSSIFLVGDREGVRRELLRALVAIPGHATSYENQIKSARERIELEGDPQFAGVRLSEYKSTRGQAFIMLGLMPSPETVRVLGEFLFDERDANAYPGSYPYEKGIGANSMLALRQIVGLPLADPPVRRPRRPNGDVAYKAEDLETWKLWYEQVKAGNRTFRFEGDPQEYNLTGPVSKAVTPREGRAAKDSLPMAEVGGGKEGSSRWKSVMLVIAALALCGATWKVLSGKLGRST